MSSTNDIFIIAIIALIALIAVFAVLLKWSSIENFYINMSTRFTRNQSYDLRGDPYVIPPNPNLSPWGMSSWAPWAYWYPRLPAMYPSMRPYVV